MVITCFVIPRVRAVEVRTVECNWEMIFYCEVPFFVSVPVGKFTSCACAICHALRLCHNLLLIFV